MRRTPRLASIALLALAAAAVPLAPVVGQSPSAPTMPAASFSIGDPALAAAIAATVDAGTVRTDFSVVFDGSSMIPDDTTITGSGQTTLGLERRMRLGVDMTAFDVGVFDVIVDGQMIYVRGLPFGDMVRPDMWLSADLANDDPMTQTLRGLASGNNDASLLLYFLLGAPSPAELLGEETIDEVPTRHLGTTLDLDRALALVPEEIRDTLAANVADIRQGGVSPVLDAEVWVDAQDLVHRVRFGYALGDPMGGGTMDVTFDFRDHGAELDLGIPAPEDTVDVSSLGG